jgi:DNA-binding response OmpR family regulator
MKAGKKILIVEDDTIISVLISRVLGSLGHSVTTAKTGKDALAKIQAAYYDMALLDIGLPDMLGTDLLKKIRKANKDMIIIMITGNPSHDSSIDSINNDADGYIVKPISNEDLVAIVERKLRKREEAKTLSDEMVSEYLKSRLSRLALEKPENKT